MPVTENTTLEAKSPHKAPKNSLLGLFKEVFNWYPSEYSSDERK